MTADEFASALTDSREIELTTTGRVSGRPSSRPVWLVERDAGIALLPVGGSSSQWYKNLLETPSIRLSAAGNEYTATARPITDPGDVADVVERFRGKYGAAAVERYYPGQDVAVEVRPA
jgi:deazaflavin-dependent oxidoreductase (nitroreductase family)